MEPLIIAIGLGAFLLSGKLPNGLKKLLNFDPLYREYGERYGVDWRLLKAVAQVESGEDPQAVNPNDPSYGLMQILYPQKLNVEDWPPKSEAQLMEPDYNVKIGAQILAWNIRSYGMWRGVAVYNRWDSRLDPEDGPYGNQNYVDRVKAKYRDIQAAGVTA